jgi:hypothetical protein
MISERPARINILEILLFLIYSCDVCYCRQAGVPTCRVQTISGLSQIPQTSDPPVRDAGVVPTA